MNGASAVLLHNWRLKLSALGLAIFLWALVQTDPRDSEVFSAVPLQVAVADTLWTLASMPQPQAVELRLGGPAREIIRLARDGVQVRIPIEEVGSADTALTLRREWVDLGETTGITVESFSPADVQLSFERALGKSVPVVLRTEGAIPGNRALSAAIAVDPSEVWVRGPRSRVAAMDSIPLEAFDLTSVQRSDLHEVPVDMGGLGGMVVEPEGVTLGVRVEDRVERVFPGRPVEIAEGEVDGDLVIEPVSVGIRVSGAGTLVASVDPSFVRVWIDPELLLNLVPGEVRTVPIRIDGVPSLVTAVPATDVVTVRRTSDIGVGGR